MSDNCFACVQDKKLMVMMSSMRFSHAPAPSGASALSELSAQLQAQRQSPVLLPTLSLCPATAWQGHCTGLLRGKFAWRRKWGSLGRCCCEQPLTPRLESINQSTGVQKPRPGDATILILNCRCQMNHNVYISPV